MALTKEERELIREIKELACEGRDIARDTKVVVGGKNGDDGMAGDLKRLTLSHITEKDRNNKFKVRIYGIICFLSGASGFSLYEILGK